MRVKPSRATVLFFVGVLAYFAARAGYDRHVRISISQDAPPVRGARQLLRCAAGRDAQRLLGERPANGELLGWSQRLTERLRHVVATAYGPTWPARCVPIADRLARQLGSDPRSGAATRYAIDVREMLSRGARDELDAIEVVEKGDLGDALASLSYAISGLSTGAEEDWLSPLAGFSTDLDVHSIGVTSAPRPLADDAVYATFSLPDLVLYERQSEHLVHRATFDTDDREDDHALGPGVPVSDVSRDGIVRLADDAGDELFLPGGEPAQLLTLPAPLRTGAESLGAWQAALSGDLLWLLTIDDGQVRLRSAPRAPPVAWSDPATLGDPESVLGALMTADPDVRGAVVLYVARRTARGVAVDRTRATASNAPLEAMVTIAEFPAFNPSMQTCVTGASGYLVLRTDDDIRLVASRGTTAHLERLAFDDVGELSERPFRVSCVDDGALLYAAFARQQPVLVVFPATGEPFLLQPPIASTSHLAGGVLLDDGRVVVVTENDADQRVFRSMHPVVGPDAVAITNRDWEGGALVADETAVGPTHAIEHRARLLALSATGAEVAALERITEAGLSYVGRLASRDGGEHWHASPR